MTFLEVEGAFKSFSGRVSIDTTDTLNSTSFCSIAVDSIDTGNTLRDRSLRSDAFLHSEKYPGITVKTGDWRRHGNQYEYVAEAEIEIKNSTGLTPVRFSVSDCDHSSNKLDQCIQVKGQTIISRNHFNLVFDSVMDGLIGDQIEVSFHITALSN